MGPALGLPAASRRPRFDREDVIPRVDAVCLRRSRGDPTVSGHRFGPERVGPPCPREPFSLVRPRFQRFQTPSPEDESPPDGSQIDEPPLPPHHFADLSAFPLSREACGLGDASPVPRGAAASLRNAADQPRCVKPFLQGSRAFCTIGRLAQSVSARLTSNVYCRFFTVAFPEVNPFRRKRPRLSVASPLTRFGHDGASHDAAR